MADVQARVASPAVPPSVDVFEPRGWRVSAHAAPLSQRRRITLEGGSHIERHVPVLPLSRDKARLAELKRSLVAYRLAFRQPRQEDLIEYLSSRFSGDEVTQLLDELRIDLAPPAASPA